MSNAIAKTITGFQIDVFGHVNNARYLEFYEEARWQLFFEPIDSVLKQGFAFVIVNININYRIALNLFEEVKITADLTRVNNRSAVISQKITSLSSDKVFSDAEVTFVLIDTKTKESVVIADVPQCAQFIHNLQQLAGDTA